MVTLSFTTNMRSGAMYRMRQWWVSCYVAPRNNQFGREEVRYQFRSGDPVLCPVLALAWIRKAARHFKTKADQPLTTMGTNGYGLGNGHVVQILKALATELGLNPDDYSTHSIRIGGATILLNNGTQSLVIKLLGW